MHRIVTVPHPALRFESRPIRRIDAGLRSVVRRMFELMYEARGIGLAANQVGLPFRVFVLNLTADPSQAAQERVFINPELSRHGSAAEDQDEEGCLSIPELYGKVRRPKAIRVRAMDLGGSLFELDADGLLGRAVQHENDHLDGTLMIDHFDDASKAASAEKLAAIEAAFRREQAEGRWPDDDAIRRDLDAMAASGSVPKWEPPATVGEVGGSPTTP